MPPSFGGTPPRRRFNQNIPPCVVLLQQCHCRNRHRGKLQNLSPASILFESSPFFTIHRRHRCKKGGPEFCNSNSVIFEIFLKFSKRRRAVPLRPIWTIMVAAKVDHSRVLVTKFHQNRSTLKGRSAVKRHTDRQTHTETDSQTNSAENNGPSGLQSGQWQRIDINRESTSMVWSTLGSRTAKEQNRTGQVNWSVQPEVRTLGFPVWFF